jgi:hypothetical protein
MKRFKKDLNLTQNSNKKLKEKYLCKKLAPDAASFFLSKRITTLLSVN